MGKKSGGRVRVKQVGPKGAAINPLADLAIPPEDMITLPPKPDTNISHFWPLSQTFSMKYEKFHVIWPTYLDSTKTIKMGRRISISNAVPDPSVSEISEALQTLNIRHVVHPYKGYPRDPESRWDNLGRIMVDLEQAKERGIGLRSGVSVSAPDGSFDIDAIPDMSSSDDGHNSSNSAGEVDIDKKVLMKEIALLIPKMPSRIQRMEEKKKAEEEEKKKQRDANRAVAASKASAGGGGSGSSKKKGKKRR